MLVRRLTAVIGLISTLNACGIAVPSIDQFDRDQTHLANFVQSVQVNVHCQLRKAVLDTYDNLKKNGNDIEWLKSWSAKITMTLNVDERSGFAPGINFTHLYPSLKTFFPSGEILTNGRSLDVGLGASISATASNELQVGWFAIFSEFFDKERAFQNYPCDSQKIASIEGDLRIASAVFAGAFPASLGNNISDPFVSGGRLDTIQHTVFFFIQSSGNVNPSFKFVEVSNNIGGDPLLGASRNRKDTLLLTMGPILEVSGRKRRPVPSLAVEAAHQSKLNGINFLSALLAAR